MKKSLSALVVFIALSACAKTEPKPEPQPHKDVYKIVGVAAVFLTTIDQQYLYTHLENGAVLYPKTDAPKIGFDVTIEPNTKFQTVLGVGASFTDASAYLINQVLSTQDRDALMVETVQSGQRHRAIVYPQSDGLLRFLQNLLFL